MVVWVLEGKEFHCGSLGIRIYSSQQEANKHLTAMNSSMSGDDNEYYMYWVRQYQVEDEYNA